MHNEMEFSPARLQREIATRIALEAQLQRAARELEQKTQALDCVTRALELRQRAIEASANAMLITSAVGPDFVIEYVNPAFEKITGYSAAEAIGRSCKFMQGEDLDQPALAEIRAALREQREGNAVLRNYRKDKTLFWNHLSVAPVRDAVGNVTHFVASQYDITAAKNDEVKLRHMAHHDELTGLPNRALLRDHLAQAVAAAARHQRQIWVLFISLDRFKVINSSLAYLKRFPIDVLKIDRTFVSDIGACEGDDAAIVMSIITLAHALKMKVVAEGVETRGQLDYLRRNGCDQVQGFYFSKPLEARQFAAFLRNQ